MSEVIKKNLADIINNEVNKLPELLKDVFILRHYQELKYDEIAEIIKISMPKVRRLIEKAAAMLLNVNMPTYALSDSQPINITLGVNSIFSLVVEDDLDQDALLALGLVDEGDTPGGNLQVICGTNRGIAWTVQIKGEDLTNAGATESITVDNITFTPWAGGGDQGVGILGTAGPVSLLDQLVYTADASEYSDSWVTVMCGIGVFVPYGTVADSYSGDLTFTMVETGGGTSPPRRRGKGRK